MKLVIATLVLLIGATTAFAKEKPKTKQIVFECSVDCHSCEEKIMKNIPYEKGVKKVEVDIPGKLVTVSFREDKNTSDGVKKALEKLGYEVRVKKEIARKK
ncbi:MULTISPECIES: heavy-metal-associated domain-containing protein [unclassified Saccharicrinis]|uniref:heavy-metal-associated domain-containing protein n=1 Tax=unclassified Saccharicrinis TaxID=2646859 RepID=UPI003D3347F2